jgi:hypothetical protein
MNDSEKDEEDYYSFMKRNSIYKIFPDSETIGNFVLNLNFLVENFFTYIKPF